MSDDFDLTPDVLAKWRTHCSTDPAGYLAGEHVVRLLDRIDALEAEREVANATHAERLRELMEERRTVSRVISERDDLRAEVERLREVLADLLVRRQWVNAHPGYPAKKMLNAVPVAQFEKWGTVLAAATDCTEEENDGD